jgi:hypothetical protein
MKLLDPLTLAGFLIEETYTLYNPVDIVTFVSYIIKVELA